MGGAGRLFIHSIRTSCYLHRVVTREILGGEDLIHFPLKGVINASKVKPALKRSKVLLRPSDYTAM